MNFKLNLYMTILTQNIIFMISISLYTKKSINCEANYYSSHCIYMFPVNYPLEYSMLNLAVFLIQFSFN